MALPFIGSVGVAMLVACGGASSDTLPNEAVTYSLSGVAQKGPFANGTNVGITELDAKLKQTGRAFSTRITDNTGAFSLPDVALRSPYVLLTANGFYFDEVADKLSASPIALDALANVTAKGSVNANLLSHLERPRVEYLISKGLSFADAKAQAQGAVAAVFGFKFSGSATSETLDIARGTDDDAKLLAISAIVQGWRTTGEVSELVTNIATELKTYGVLNDTRLGSDLMNGAVLLNLPAVRTHLEKRYQALGMQATVGNFEQYVKAFIAAAKYPVTVKIIYPATGQNGINLLDPAITSYSRGSFRADLPRGTSLKVVLTLTAGRGYLGGWWYSQSQAPCWYVTDYDYVNNRQELTISSFADDRSCDLAIELASGASVRVDYYENYELGTPNPTSSKIVTMQAGDASYPSYDAGYPEGDGGYCRSDGSFCVSGAECCSGLCNGYYCSSGSNGDASVPMSDASACKPLGDFCNYDYDCCSANCRNSHCQAYSLPDAAYPDADAGCASVGSFCSYNTQCCTGLCYYSSCVPYSPQDASYPADVGDAGRDGSFPADAGDAGRDASYPDDAGDAGSCPAPTTGDLVISEYMSNPIGDDSAREWLEIFVQKSVDLNGVKLTVGTTSLDLASVSTCVQAGQYLLLARSVDPTTNGGVTMPIFRTFSVSLTNTSQTLALTLGAVTIDALTTQPSPTEGDSWQLSSEKLDATLNDTTGNWCASGHTYGAGGKGTPGFGNRTCP